MRTIGIQELDISSLVLPDEWDSIVKEQASKDLAHSFRRVGMLQEPIVRRDATDDTGTGCMELLCGRHRVAAHQIQGKTKVLCKVVECADLEADIIRREENVVRWHSPGEKTKQAMELRDLYAKLYEEHPELAPPPPPGKRGPKRTPRGSADLVVAELTGRKVDSFRGAAWRQKKREIAQAEAEEPALIERKPLPIETYGVSLSDEYVDGVRSIRDHMLAAYDQLKTAQGWLTRLEKLDLYPRGMLSRLKASVHDVTAELGDAVPASLCPYCKGLPDVMANCAGCVGLGLVGASVLSRVPDELLDTAHPMVSVSGKLVPVEEALGDPFGAP